MLLNKMERDQYLSANKLYLYNDHSLWGKGRKTCGKYSGNYASSTGLCLGHLTRGTLVCEGYFLTAEINFLLVFIVYHRWERGDSRPLGMGSSEHVRSWLSYYPLVWLPPFKRFSFHWGLLPAFASFSSASFFLFIEDNDLVWIRVETVHCAEQKHIALLNHSVSFETIPAWLFSRKCLTASKLSPR